MRLLVWLAGTGCVAAMERPCGEEDVCPGGFACEADGFGCRTGCSSAAHCQTGYACSDGRCSGSPCYDEECPGFLVCGPGSQGCLVACGGDEDCRDGAVCCSPEDESNGVCPEMNRCYLP